MDRDQEKNQRITLDLLPINPPPRHLFRPTDDQLLSLYLRPRRDRLPLPEDNPFHETNIFNYRPQQLAETYAARDGAFYFFTSLMRVRMKNGQTRVHRRNLVNGEGSWGEQLGPLIQIQDWRGYFIGTRRDLRYMSNNTPGSSLAEGRWILEEFFLNPQDNGLPGKWSELAAYRLYPDAMRRTFREARDR